MSSASRRNSRLSPQVLEYARIVLARWSTSLPQVPGEPGRSFLLKKKNRTATVARAETNCERRTCGVCVEPRRRTPHRKLGTNRIARLLASRFGQLRIRRPVPQHYHCRSNWQSLRSRPRQPPTQNTSTAACSYASCKISSLSTGTLLAIAEALLPGYFEKSQRGKSAAVRRSGLPLQPFHRLSRQTCTLLVFRYHAPSPIDQVMVETRQCLCFSETSRGSPPKSARSRLEAADFDELISGRRAVG